MLLLAIAICNHHPRPPLAESVMRFFGFCFSILLLGLATGVVRSDNRSDPNVASTPHRTPEEERRLFHLPPGFEIQLVAAEPDIHKPLNLAFDDRGRLWVTDTVEYPFPPPPGRKSHDSVKILDDFAPDGRARKITTFADDLVIPIGVLPLTSFPRSFRGNKEERQDALVFSIPSIYRLRASKGNEHADSREVLYTGYGQRDTHGLTGSFTWGFDGWIYAVHGFANDSTVKARDGSSITMNSGNTYRIRPDGSRIEYFTHGQVNPYGLSFDPLGNLYSADCHTQPIYQLLRGAWYPSFGKGHDGLGFGPAMYSGYTESTAVAGIAYYAADNYPLPWRDCAYVGDVVSHRVNQFVFQWHGSSPKASLKRFLESDDPWFRPVYIQLGPDGALYIADFYNRIIGHYEVPLTHPGRDRTSGRIWRIVYRGTNLHSHTGDESDRGTPAPRKDWTTARTAELIDDLAHPNLTVRVHAMNQLVERGGKEGQQALQELLHSGKANHWQWVHGLWILERSGALQDEVLIKAANHKDRVVRVHVQRILSERTQLTLTQHALVLAALKDADANVQRAAADALGQHPDAAKNLRPLLELRHVVPKDDTHLLHVVRMALRDQLRSSDAWPQLADGRWNQRDRQAIADVALGVPSAEAAAYLMTCWQRQDLHGDMRIRAAHHIARYGSETVTRQLADLVRRSLPKTAANQTPRETPAENNRVGPGNAEEATLFFAVQRGTLERGSRLTEPIRAWGTDLARRLLASKDNGEIEVGIKLVGELQLAEEQKRLVEIASKRSKPEGQRRAALEALVKLDTSRSATVLAAVLADTESPIALREQSANLLAQANLPQTQEELLKILPTAPARLQRVIAIGLAASPAGAEKLLQSVQTGKASARLLQEPFVRTRLDAANLPRLAERIEKLTAGLPPADADMQALLHRRRIAFLKAKKDAIRGAQIFTKHCANCHQVGGQGARIGPQLDGVGVRGLDRLLEDILDPNRNVDQAFRQTTLTLKKGQVLTGLLLREEGEVLVLADSQGKEMRVAKNEVEERVTSQTSPMPGNFAEQIPESDFNHLLAYLLTLQSKLGTP